MKYSSVKKYKYQLTAHESVQTNITNHTVQHRFFSLEPSGKLTIYSRYMWDGCSGPTWDTKSTMRAGLFHDALYQMIRLRLLPHHCKYKADKLLRRLMIEDGAWKVRADYFYWAVEEFGHRSCIPGDVRIPEEIEI